MKNYDALLSIKTLWQLLDLAIADTKAIMQQPRYVLDGNFWNYEIIDQASVRDVYNQTGTEVEVGQCVVCFAGCVLRNTLESDEGLDVKEMPHSVYFQMQALNDVRNGNILRAIHKIHGSDFEIPDEVKDLNYCYMHSFTNDPAQFLQDVELIRDQLNANDI